MSFLSKVWKGIRGAVAPVIGTAVGGPLGGVLGGLLGGSRVPSMANPQPAAPAAPNWAAFGGSAPGVGSALMPAAAVIPSAGRALLPLAGAGLGGLARGAGYAAGRLAGAAASYCRRNPAWCAAIGGTAAVEGMIRAGQLPMPKRRRGRGITATELRNFKRVAKFTAKYCAPVRRAMKAPVMTKRGR